MDILVQLASGALVNVEIQRCGYLFPGARCACYSSDLVMRQYSQVREQKRAENKTFSYKDIRKVYTIVLIQKITAEFHKFPNDYLHYSRQTFNTGLTLDMLQEYLIIPLDIFLKTKDNIDSKLDAWLYFIASSRLEDIQKVIAVYPEFCELYQEVFQFRFQPKEWISMFSEALRILDANTVQYMIEEQQKTIDDQKAQIKKAEEAIAEKDNAIAKLDDLISSQAEEIQRLKSMLKSNC